MTRPVLRVTGAGGTPYILGAPMHVYDDEVHLGTVTSVQVGPGGHEIAVGNFVASNLADLYRSRLVVLVVVEVVQFLIDNYPSVQTIGLTLSGHVEDSESERGGLAGVRSDLLRSIGAGNVTITPSPHGRLKAHFAVSGIWTYNPAACAALASVLDAERQAFGERKAADQTVRATMIHRLLARLLFRRR